MNNYISTQHKVYFYLSMIWLEIALTYTNKISFFYTSYKNIHNKINSHKVSYIDTYMNMYVWQNFKSKKSPSYHTKMTNIQVKY